MMAARMLTRLTQRGYRGNIPIYLGDVPTAQLGRPINESADLVSTTRAGWMVCHRRR